VNQTITLITSGSCAMCSSSETIVTSLVKF